MRHILEESKPKWVSKYWYRMWERKEKKDEIKAFAWTSGWLFARTRKSEWERLVRGESRLPFWPWWVWGANGDYLKLWSSRGRCGSHQHTDGVESMEKLLLPSEMKKWSQIYPSTWNNKNKLYKIHGTMVFKIQTSENKIQYPWETGKTNKASPKITLSYCFGKFPDCNRRK